MRLRVDDLAARCGVSVDTVRFYQARGLIDAPAREGRVAWYSDTHVVKLERIRDLKGKGFTLASIRRFLDGDLDDADEALVAALARPAVEGPATAEARLTLDELAAKTGVSRSILEAVQREGLLIPALTDGTAAYTAADAAAVSAGVELLEAGVPLTELLALARAHEDAMRSIAERAVDLFDDYVRRPAHASSGSSAEAGARLVDTFNRMLRATTSLVAHHFGRVLVAAARARVERDDAPHERDPRPSRVSR